MDIDFDNRTLTINGKQMHFYSVDNDDTPCYYSYIILYYHDLNEIHDLLDKNLEIEETTATISYKPTQFDIFNDQHFIDDDYSMCEEYTVQYFKYDDYTIFQHPYNTKHTCIKCNSWW